MPLHHSEYAEFDNPPHYEPSLEYKRKYRSDLIEPVLMIVAVIIKHRADDYYFFISLTYSSYSTSPSSALVLISMA